MIEYMKRKDFHIKLVKVAVNLVNETKGGGFKPFVETVGKMILKVAWTSGLGHDPFKVEIAGSNPAASTK